MSIIILIDKDKMEVAENRDKWRDLEETYTRQGPTTLLSK